ncbi:MAG: efflux RND transporter periplasmic adaptor subunit [bacterium]
MKRWILGAVIALVVAGIVFANLKREAGKVATIQAEQAARRNLVTEVTASGRIQPKREVKVSATRMGRITRLGVAEGDRVSAGDFLVEIDPAPYSSAVDRLRAGLAAMRAQLDVFKAEEVQARQERDRVLRLRDGGLASPAETEKAETLLAVAAARVAAAAQQVAEAKANLDNAAHELSEVTIKSETDGIITRLNVEAGETAIVGTMNVPGTELLRIADLSVMEAEVKVDETDVVDVALGQAARVSIDSYPDTTFAGVVSEIGNSPILDASGARDQSVDFKVVVTLTETVPGVRPGLTAKAEITVATRDSVIAVPIQALTVRRPKDLEAKARGGASASAETNASDDPSDPANDEIEGVFLVESGRANFRAVVTGTSSDKYFEVLSGLEPGETVVTGDFKAIRELTNGQRVKIEKPGAKGKKAKS